MDKIKMPRMKKSKYVTLINEECICHIASLEVATLHSTFPLRIRWGGGIMILQEN